MNILVKIISFLSLLLISCNNYTPNYKRIQGDALGTTYQVIVQSELSSIEIKQSIDEVTGLIRSRRNYSDFEGDFQQVCNQLFGILESGTTIDLAKKT